jgi:molybdate transport system substrate-binding protein
MFPASRHRRSIALVAFVAAAVVPVARAGEITLALANSTCDAMHKVADLYRADHPVRFSYLCKSSGLLAKGLHGGALSADVFVSADRQWMDFVVERGLAAPSRVSSPWGNALVVATPKSSALQRLEWQDLASDQVTVILIGDPSNAPFGRHAKDALEASGLWDRVKHKIQTRKHVELLAASLATGEPGTVGILFKSNLTDALRPLHQVDQRLHRPIRYYVAPLNSAAGNAEVAAFLRFLHGPAATRVFRADGFEVRAP